MRTFIEFIAEQEQTEEDMIHPREQSAEAKLKAAREKAPTERAARYLYIDEKGDVQTHDPFLLYPDIEKHKEKLYRKLPFKKLPKESKDRRSP